MATRSEKISWTVASVCLLVMIFGPTWYMAGAWPLNIEHSVVIVNERGYTEVIGKRRDAAVYGKYVVVFHAASGERKLFEVPELARDVFAAETSVEEDENKQ